MDDLPRSLIISQFLTIMSRRILSRQAFSVLSHNTHTSAYPIALHIRNNVRKSSTNDYSKMPENDTPGPGPNSESLPHVSEEAAMVGKIMGDKFAPDLSEGTPVEEVRDAWR